MEIYVEVMQNGNLKLTTHDDFVEEIVDAMKTKTDDCILADALEHYSCNGSYTPFNAGNANPFVGLTDAPCIAESMIYHDDGELEINGDAWFYDNYMIRCPIQEMIEKGYVIFTKFT